MRSDDKTSSDNGDDRQSAWLTALALVAILDIGVLTSRIVAIRLMPSAVIVV